MNYGKGNWPVLDQALHKKAGYYNLLVEGIIEEFSAINGTSDFCKESGLSDTNLTRILTGQVSPRPNTLLKIIKALVDQRNRYRSQLKNLKHVN